MKIESLQSVNDPIASLLVTVSEEKIFKDNILASTTQEIEQGWCEIFAIREAKSQSSALNAGIEMANSDLIICPHQDVFFLPKWLDILIDLKNTAPEPWGILGSAGTDSKGQMWGTHSGLGMGSFRHVEAQTLDGSCLILRKSSKLRFDEKLNRFHGYDIDICLRAREQLFKNYVISLPMQHNTRWASTEGKGAEDLHNALKYIQEKWKPRGVGPIYTTIGTY